MKGLWAAKVATSGGLFVMKLKKYDDLNKGERIIADLYSRPNAVNGKYRVGQLGLDDMLGIKDKDFFFLETLQMKADLADKMIAEAESQGKNTSDREVMRELGKEINAIGTPIHRIESIMTVVWNSLQLMGTYGIVAGIWGLVFQKSFFVFGFYGAIAGLLISLMFIAPVIVFQRTREKIRDMSFGSGSMWLVPALFIGVLGIIVFLIRLIFF